MIKNVLKLIHEPIYKRRIEVLSSLVVPQLRPGDKILDIGCGSGALGAAVLTDKHRPAGISYCGLERAKRGREPIDVIEHTEGPLPFADSAFDVVILADVLHHEERESFLISEATRVCKRLLLIKDHKPEGFMGFWRICFLDWAANDPYNVKCLYRYHTMTEWAAIFDEHKLSPVAQKTSIDLYPPLPNLIFGKRLQYFAVLTRSDEAPAAPTVEPSTSTSL
jgi:ubiquinone/menaquinone biosynthesis C-methylase UbiE